MAMSHHNDDSSDSVSGSLYSTVHGATAAGVGAAAGVDAPAGVDAAAGVDAPAGVDAAAGVGAAAGVDAASPMSMRVAPLLADPTSLSNRRLR